MACRECHSAKVKCEKVIPCARCIRLSKVCIRHESRQGQGRAKKRARNKISEDAAMSAEVGTLHPNHYGLHYLIRSWVSLAMRRRNFGLLARAGMIADRSGISMDAILCENPALHRRGMDYLYSILLTPSAQQSVVGNRLGWSDIPNALRVATGCVGATDGLSDPIVADRWIWIREIRNGISRYLVTPAFERDIADWSLMQQTYQENKKSVVEIFLAPSDIPKHTKAFAHQVSCHATQGTPISSNRMKSKVKLKNKQRYGGLASVDVDQIFSLCIHTLDHDFTYAEYVPRLQQSSMAEDASVVTSSNSPATVGAVVGMNNNNNNNVGGMLDQQSMMMIGMNRQQQQMSQQLAQMANMNNQNNNNNQGNNQGNSNNNFGNNNFQNTNTNNNNTNFARMPTAASASAQADLAGSNSNLDADAIFKSGLDMGLPLLDLDAFDDDLDLDFFMNVLK